MRRRRWLQFSLSSLFLLVTALCVWLGIVVNQARKQREAVAAIEAAEGAVYYDWEEGHDPFGDEVAAPPGLSWLRRLVGDEYFQSIYSVNLQNAKISDDLLRHVGGQTSITELRLGNPQIGDHELAFLSELHRLQFIDFLPLAYAGMVEPEGENTHRITAAGIRHFRRLPNLKTLRLSKSAFGDEGLAILGEISTLEELTFDDPQVTDAGFEHLKYLKNLKVLSFNAPLVTDAGTEHLRSLTKLERLVIDEAKITDRGFESLRGLKKLRQLFVQTFAPGITDTAFENLAGLSELQELYVITHGDHAITDAGLLRLKGLSKLRALNVPSRGITDQGVKLLQQAIPGCKIHCK